MSDVIWAAIIAVMGSVISGGVAGWISYKVATRQARVTESTAALHANVELTRIGAENERLRQQVAEAERSNRQGTYHRLISLLSTLDGLGIGSRVTGVSFEDAMAEFEFLQGGILLFGDEQVAQSFNSLTDAFNELGRDMAQRSGSDVERFQAAYPMHRTAITVASGALLAEMRRDVAFPG